MEIPYERLWKNHHSVTIPRLKELQKLISMFNLKAFAGVALHTSKKLNRIACPVTDKQTAEHRKGKDLDPGAALSLCKEVKHQAGNDCTHGIKVLRKSESRDTLVAANRRIHDYSDGTDQ